MPELVLGLEGVTIVLTVRGQPFTLTAPTARVTASTGGGSGGGSGAGSQPLDANIHFKYEKPFEESLDLGTPAEVLAAIEELTSGLPGTSGPALVAQWDTLKNQLQGVPILNQASQAALNTQVRRIRFEIAFSRVPLVTPTEYWAGFSLGLVFVPNPADMPSLLGAKLTRFGAVLHVSGRAKASDLGLPA